MVSAIQVVVTLNVADLPVSFGSGNLLMLPGDIFTRYVSQIGAKISFYANISHVLLIFVKI